MRFRIRILFWRSVLKTNPLKTNFTLLLAVVCGLFSCSKERIQFPVKAEFLQESKPCLVETSNPAGRSYVADSLVEFNCADKYCGFMPLSSRNYWVYADSIFNNGVFTELRYDTLRFRNTVKSVNDGLVWWEAGLDLGLPARIYTSDSALFGMEDRMFSNGIRDVKKEFGLFAGDSVRYISGFRDAAAITRSLKWNNPVHTEAGDFTGCIYIDKNARNYRRDQVFFKPGVGVIRYVREEAPMGSPRIKLQRISTLVSYSFE